jgi:hypothetical protein
LKIDGLTPSCFNNHDLAGQLGLKDGQKIIGRIIGFEQGEVLLQLAGKTIAAKLEGEPAPQGSLVLFGVSILQAERIELKVIGNLSQPDESGENTQAPASADDPRIKSLISAALKEFGLTDSPQNIEKIFSSLKAFESKYQQLLDPKVFSFLMEKNLPVTPGTVLFSWLYQDKELRNVLWNLLNRSPWVRDNPALLPKIVDLKGEFPVFQGPGFNPESELLSPDEPITVQTGKEVGSGSESPTVPSGSGQTETKDSSKSSASSPPSPNPAIPGQAKLQPEPLLPLKTHPQDAFKTGILRPSQVSSEGQELQNPGNKSDYGLAEIEKFKTVLEQSLRLEQAGNEKNQINGGETIIPFLVRTPENTLREYIVKWNEKSSHTDRGEKLESVRVIIPTENMGDITLQMLVSSKKVRIGLKVTSDPVKNHITQNLGELKAAVGHAAQIAVTTVVTKSGTEGGMDLWM